MSRTALATRAGLASPIADADALHALGHRIAPFSLDRARTQEQRSAQRSASSPLGSRSEDCFRLALPFVSSLAGMPLVCILIPECFGIPMPSSGFQDALTVRIDLAIEVADRHNVWKLELLLSNCCGAVVAYSRPSTYFDNGRVGRFSGLDFEVGLCWFSSALRSNFDRNCLSFLVRI
jgi:hypothetical protein